MQFTATKRELSKAERGGALIELALILPVLAIMAVGVANFGMALREKQIIVEAARYGARRAAADGDPICSLEAIPAERCNHILANIPELPDPRSLGMYYACQSIEQGGLNPGQWEVFSDLDVDGTKPSVEVRVQRSTPAHFFITSLVGPAFPSTSGAFVSQKGCQDAA